MLACILLTGVAQSARPAHQPAKFDILGASVDVRVTREHTTLPATLVPYLKAGDTIDISFPRGVQFSRSPRWHLVVADMYRDYLRHAPRFAIRDADLSSAKAGFVWRVHVKANATPIMFLVPENGNRYGHGIPDARRAIATLANRGLLLRTATLSANAQVKESTLGLFLRSLAALQPGQLADGRARVAAVTQSLFGYDLQDASCFNPDMPQTTQYACAAQAIASNYENVPKADVISAIGSQLPITAATYGMLAGALYQLLAKRRIDADYLFEPGVIKPGGENTNVFVEHQPSYDASAAHPSSIVYFEVGSHATSPRIPAYGTPSPLPVCAARNTLAFALPFSGLPVYFRSHHAIVHAGSSRFALPVTYDPLSGYRLTLTASQHASLGSRATVRIESLWGFDTFESAPVTIVQPRAATWAPENAAQSIVMGARSGTLAFSDTGAGVGACVQSVQLKDATGSVVPVASIHRSNDGVTVDVDPAKAVGPTGEAVIQEAGGVSSAPLTVQILPPMPQVAHAVAYLPKGALVLQGVGLKYINTITLDRTGIVFGGGSPNADGSWTFTAQTAPTYQAAWEHETMAISFTLQPPDTRTGSVQADVQYAASP